VGQLMQVLRTVAHCGCSAAGSYKDSSIHPPDIGQGGEGGVCFCRVLRDDDCSMLLCCWQDAHVTGCRVARRSYQ
jgi:hypothetical protein